MQNITQWLFKQAKRSERFVSIADLLFANKSIAYIYFRLRYFNWLVLIRLVFHLVIFYSLHRHVQPQAFSLIGGLWAFSLLASSAWWGGLEVLRTRVRDYFSLKDSAALNQEISRWCRLGLIIGVVCLLGSLAFFINGWLLQTGAFIWFFSSAILFNLALRLMLEPYHSGIYAISRVLRPIGSLIFGELIGMMIVLIGWPWLHTSILPLAFVIAGGVNVYLRYHYCQRMYDFYELAIDLPKATLMPLVKQFPYTDFCLAGLAMIMINIEGLLLGTTFGLHQTHAIFDPLFTVLFLTLPLVNASGEWAQLFYFDWKKLQRFNFASLQQHYHRTVLRLSPLIGLAIGIFAILTGILLLKPIHPVVYGILILLLLTRAVIAYLQIKAFAQFYYKDVVVSGAFMLLGLLLAYYLCASLWLSSGSFILALSLVIGYLSKPRLAKRDKISRFKQQVNLYDWLTHLSNATGRVRVHKLKVAPETSYYKILRIIEVIGKAYLGAADRVCILANEMLFFQLDSEEKLDLASLAINTGGLIQTYQVSPTFEKVAVGFHPALQRYLLEHITKLAEQWLAQPFNQDTFFQQFPDAIYFKPQCILGSQASLPDKNTMHSLLYQAELFLTGRVSKRFPYAISVIYATGTIQAICAIPKVKYSGKLLRAWRAQVNEANIRAILNFKEQ